MREWWNALHLLQQALFVIAVATTLLMIVQIVLMLVGGDTDGDACDADFSGDGDVSVGDGDGACGGHGNGFTVFGLRILTVRTVIAFLAIGSWIAFTLDFVMPTYGAILLGIAAGIGAAFATAYMIHLVMKLQNSGNIDFGNSVGRTAEVYLTVPPARSGVGKITLKLQERLIEMEAMSDGDTAIHTGAQVKIMSVADDVAVVMPVADAERVGAGE